MTPVFADASYWIALIFQGDTYYRAALGVAKRLAAERRTVVTSQMVLTEFLNFFASFGTYWRGTAVQFLDSILADPNTLVVEQSDALFKQAVEFYSQRKDKDWGLTDCASLVIMAEHGLTEALTTDRHFEQAGFFALLRETV